MSLKADAHAVLLPAIDDLMLTDPMAHFLDKGGRALLIGETRAEYVARRMSDARRRGESADKLRALTDRITGLAGPALVALDQEPSGIRRLHGLVPQLPDNEVLYAMASEETERVAFRMAQAARGMGVTMFLSPVIDVVTGHNPWLQGRTLGTDAAEVARIGCAFIRGVETAGVVATAKHFPGHHDIDGDPAVDAATVSGGADALAPGMVPFRAAIAAGVRAVMTGPALVPGMDAVMPSSLSATTIAALRGGGWVSPGWWSATTSTPSAPCAASATSRRRRSRPCAQGSTCCFCRRRTIWNRSAPASCRPSPKAACPRNA